MGAFLQQLVDGMTWGALYGALALSLVLVYRASATVNFAQGEMAMIATYFTWQFYTWGAPLIVAIAISMAISFAGGVAVERTLVRPLSRTTSHLPVIIITLGLMLLINSIAGRYWGYNSRVFPSVVPDGVLSIGRVTVSRESLVLVGAVTLVAALLYALFEHTKLGLGMRASVNDPVSARLIGIPVDRMRALGWGLAAAVGALVGALAAPQLFLQPNMFLSSLIYAFAAAILGGLDSPHGALIGGLVVGVSENLVGAYVDWVGTDFKQAVALVIIMAVLAVRPRGLFGARTVARV